MRRILGVDPGSDESAYCLLNSDLSIALAGKLPNGEFMTFIRALNDHDEVVVEGMRGMGKRVGHETFDTAYMVGRVQETSEARGLPCTVYHRPDYLHPLCGGRPPAGKSDATLWACLKVRFGGSEKGEALRPLVSATDLRSAFAVAVWHSDSTRKGAVKK